MPTLPTMCDFTATTTHCRVTDTITNRRGQNLAAHYWYPPAGVQVRCLVYLSHGFSEHLGLYKEVGEFIGPTDLVQTLILMNS